MAAGDHRAGLGEDLRRPRAAAHAEAAVPPAASCARSQASMKGSRSPSSTASALPTSVSGAEVLHHAVGMQDVGADLVSEADVGLPLRDGGHLLLLLALLQLVEPRLQDLHRHRLVLVLRALVLAGDHDAGGKMRETDRRVGLVHVLAAGAARAVGVDAQVLVADLDLDVLLDVRASRAPTRTRSAGARWRRTARCGRDDARPTPPWRSRRRTAPRG